MGNIDNYSLKKLIEDNNIEQENEPTLLTNSPYVDHESLCNIIKDRANVFKVLGLNIQSINAKFDQLLVYMDSFGDNSCPFEAICLQETWLGNNHSSDHLNIDNYNLITKPCKASTHGGLAIYLKNDIQFEILDITESPSNIWEGLFIRIHMPHNVSFILGNIYRPPRDVIANYQCFINEFENVIKQFNSDIIVCGDYNIDLLKYNEKAIINDFFENILSNGLIPKITFPTRFTANNGTLIDNALVKISNNFSNTTSGICTFNLSDHLPYFVCLDYLSGTNSSPRYVKVVNNSENDYENLRKYLHEMQICDKLQSNPSQDVNAKYNIFDEILTKGIEKHIPTKLVKFNKYKHKRNKWVTKGIINSIKFRDKLYHKMKSTTINTTLYNTLKVNLNTYNNILRKLIREAKRLYFHSLFSKFKNDLKNTWKTINDVMGRSKSKEKFPEHFIIDNTAVSDSQSIADSFNNFFTKIGPDLANNIAKPNNKEFTDYLHNPCSNHLVFQPITAEYTMKLINNLHSKNSTGIDGISTKLLKNIKHVIYKPITMLINYSLNSGVFPTLLKIAKITPVYKKNDNRILDNYRPISILPSVSKLFERVIHNQINQHFICNNLYFNGQYGFREFHSTELATIELIDRIIIDCDKGNTPINIYMDLSKAFDTINHDILLSKLKHYGFIDNSLSLLRSYLTNRKQYVEFNESKSNKLTITTGVPQGSILGPLLFIIYINDISNSSNIFNFITYADDTTLYVTLNSTDPNIPTQMEAILNTELNNVNDWLDLNKLSLNISKTKCMSFQPTNRTIPLPKLLMRNTPIEYVKHFNYLGIIIDDKLNWKIHVENIAKKISKTICIMNKLKYYLPITTLKTIYDSLINSYLNYGILCWGLRPNRLFKLQKKAVRIITGSRNKAHTDPLFKKLNILKLDDIIIRKLYKFYFRYVKNHLPQYFINNMKIVQVSHQHNTRHSRYLIPRVQHKYAEYSIRYQIPLLVNRNDHNIIDKINTHSESGFALYTKKYLINQYPINCNIQDCYICHH